MDELRLRVLMENAIKAYDKLLDGCKIGPKENRLRVLLTELNMTEEEYDEIINKTYTVYLYDDLGCVYDVSEYNDKREAVKFAMRRKWNEVVCDQTGETVWELEVTE